MEELSQEQYIVGDYKASEAELSRFLSSNIHEDFQTYIDYLIEYSRDLLESPQNTSTLQDVYLNQGRLECLRTVKDAFKFLLETSSPSSEDL